MQALGVMAQGPGSSVQHLLAGLQLPTQHGSLCRRSLPVGQRLIKLRLRQQCI